jgi:thioredoxin-related protein
MIVKIKSNRKGLHTIIISIILCKILLFSNLPANPVSITIHLRGVYESKVSLIPLAGKSVLKPVIVKDGITKENPEIIMVPDSLLPGEFVLRFDYKEYSYSTPYPSEKRILMGNQDLELWVHPVYSNNPDSTWFQKDERENTAYNRFISENIKRKEQLGLLQNFLLNYDNNQSKLYKAALKEYKTRRNTFNNWVETRREEDKNLFASTLYRFQHVPEISWGGSEAARKKSLRDNYLDGMDFSDPLLVKTSTMKEWMDGYVNLYGELATTIALRDSLFTLVGKTAIEKARKGNPLVYSWMVDYFFKGYESFNIEKGIKMLRPYLDDPDCLTSKRQEINKRLKGIETLVPGTIAPNITLNDAENNLFDLNNFKTGKNYILLLFWSADCSHCRETVEKLYPWYLQEENKQKVDIVAISVDETRPEIKAWQEKITELSGWNHLRAPEGIRSKVANDYFILSVPVMVLLDSKTKEIVALPDSAGQLNELIKL